jgi:hypothetical protein
MNATSIIWTTIDEDTASIIGAVSRKRPGPTGPWVRSRPGWRCIERGCFRRQYGSR